MITRIQLATTENILCSTTTGVEKALISMLFFNPSAVAQTINIHIIPNGETMGTLTQVATWDIPPNDWSEWTSDSKLILEGGDKVSVTAVNGAIINAFANFTVM